MLLLLTVSLLPACERADVHGEIRSGFSLQARMEGEQERVDGPYGPCACEGDCRSFSINRVVTEETGPSQYDFYVSLRKTSECNGNLLYPHSCQFTGKRYYLSFLNGLDRDDFQEPHALDTNGKDLQVYDGDSDGMLYVKEPADIYFRWSDANQGNLAPTISEVSAGGICIIGVITDPCFPCPDRGRPIRPIVPRRF